MVIVMNYVVAVMGFVSAGVFSSFDTADSANFTILFGVLGAVCLFNGICCQIADRINQK